MVFTALAVAGVPPRAARASKVRLTRRLTIRKAREQIRRVIDMGGPDWPLGDPAAIMRWFEAGGKEDLGRHYNNWKALIYTCTSSIWYRASSFEERKGFRDAALAVAEAGRSMGVISAADYTEHVVYTRMSYLRNSGEQRAWRESEMQVVAGIFLD